MHREVLTEHVETLKGMDRDDGTNEYRTATDSVDGNVNDSVDDKDKRMSENEERGITGLLRSTTTEATETKHSSNTTIADKKDIEGTHRRNESVDLLQQTSTDDSDANDNASAGVNTTISALGDGDSGKKATADDDQDVGGDEIDDEGFGVSTLNYLDDLFKRTGITDSIEKTVLKTQGVAHNVSSFVKRYVRNNFYDSDKQNGLNLYLGYYQPSLDEKKALWEFDPLKSLPAPVTAPFPFASVSSSTSSLVSKASFTFSDTSPYLYSYYSASSSSFNHHNTAFHSMQTDGQMPASLDHTTEKASSHNYYYYQDLYLRKRQSCIGTGDSSTVHGPMKARSASDTMYDDSPVSSSASLPSPMLSLSAEGAPSPAAFRARGRTPSSLQREFTKFMTAEERKAVNISLVALLQRKRPRVLFITQRSKNENIVVYECNGLVKRNGRVDFSDEPMEAYWLKIDPAYVARSRKKGGCRRMQSVFVYTYISISTPLQVNVCTGPCLSRA